MPNSNGWNCSKRGRRRQRQDLFWDGRCKKTYGGQTNKPLSLFWRLPCRAPSSCISAHAMPIVKVQANGVIVAATNMLFTTSVLTVGARHIERSSHSRVLQERHVAHCGCTR
jgi:hypothetical protein